GGPAGLGCAFELARLGHEVDLYNDGPPGGVPLKSIPPFRLPGEDLARDTEFLRSHFSLHETVIDRRVFDSVAASHDALFIAVGLGHDRPLGIPGENLRNVYPVLGFLETAKRNPRSLTIGSRVIVVGGGNVSLDAASTAVKLGADEVTLLYRRSEEQMLVWRAELAAARRLGVVFRFLSAPVSIAGKDRVEGVLCRGMRLGERVDGSGRPVPVPIPGSDTLFPADSVIVAIGQDLSAGWLPPLARTARGHISVDGSFRTSVAGMFAGGDAATGEGTVVRSLADGVQAARSMHQYMTGGG
ncbi:MAG TPA: FAD-dependent oxidoreductase, partial [Bacteroidota bacterium]|nr:FAD-dependent oxidoreductase [Bacteroidota bacterium]